MTHRLLLLALLTLLRCLVVSRGYTNRLNRLLHRRRLDGKRNSHDDSSWANGEGARGPRRFLCAFFTILALVQLHEGLSVWTSTLPSLIHFAGCELLVELLERLTKTPIRVANERHRWLQRSIRHFHAGWTLWGMCDSPYLVPEHFHRTLIVKAIAGLALFVDFEEIALDLIQPLAIISITGRYHLLPDLLLRCTKILIVVAVVISLQIRGKLWRRASQVFSLKPTMRNRRGLVKNVNVDQLRAQRPMVVLALTTTVLLISILIVLANGSHSDGSTRRGDAREFIASIRFLALGCFALAVALRRGWISCFRDLETRMTRFYEWERTDRHSQMRRKNLLTTSLLSSLITLAFLTPHTYTVIPFVLFSIHHRMKQGDDGVTSTLAFVARLAVLLSLDEFRITTLMLFFLLGRLILVFDQRPIFSKVWSESLAHLGAGVLAAPPPDEIWTTYCAFASVLAVLVVALSVQIAQFQAFELMRSGCEMYAYLDHTVKQKLAAVSCALEQTCDETRDPLVHDVLREACVSTRMHHDACHLISKMHSSTFVGTRGVTTPQEATGITRAWGPRMKQLGVDLIMCNMENVEVAMDWELAYYFVFSMSRDLSLEVRATRGGRLVRLTCRCEEEKLALYLEYGYEWRVGALRRKEVAWAARELGAKVGGRTMAMSVRARVTKGETLKRFSGGEENNATIPPGCVFGVLDDVALLRAATLSFFLNEFRASPKSFACGESPEDVDVHFFELIRERKPHVLVIDFYVNLPLSPSGVDVAKRCRAAGFEGIILIYTANEEVTAKLDFGVVDGYLAKDFSKMRYAQVIGRALRSLV